MTLGWRGGIALPDDLSLAQHGFVKTEIRNGLYLGSPMYNVVVSPVKFAFT
jgi:hypothetical protein